MTTKLSRLLFTSLGPFITFGCIRNGEQNNTDGSAYTLRSMPGIAREVSDKKPKYKLYCASDLSSLKSPGSSHLIKEFDSIALDKALEISDSSKVTDSSYCLIDVVMSDPSHESLFKWISKGANGTTMKGVFYRSNVAKLSANKLDFKLYRTHELASSGTLDLFAKITFPSNIKASDAKDAILTCGTAQYSSVASTSDQTTTTLSNISFSLPKSIFVGKVTTCSVKTNIGNDTYSADNIKVEPKATDSKIDVAITVSKQSTDPKTMIIQTTIK